MGSSFMRSRTDRRIAGLCGGIAQSQGWNSTVVRLVWVAMVLFAGTGVLAYIVLWIVIPEEPIALPPYAGYAPPVHPAYGYGQQPPSPVYPQQPPPGYPQQPPPPGYGQQPQYPGAQTYQGPSTPPDPSAQS